MTVDEFRTALIDRCVRLLGAPPLGMPEVDAAIDEEGLDASDEFPIDGHWRVFTPIAGEVAGMGPDDELFNTFLSVWAGPYPEEQFLDKFELEEAVDGSELPAEFRELAPSAEEGYLAYDEPAYGALFSTEWGWALASPDRVLRFRSPLDLLDHLLAQASVQA